ncbi:DUF3239 domain-containing protein [Corynebacterium halotolerans]|uniref:DUF3239 domain-containing protein n=1 Tax=Corynebacterium halotolerans YIM 70093 = DSM 44683 TaxID=1121362 RepID=M1MVP9_9CORY|nr:DUF3239 domain-containing protein [Corynebacterium halotolerans]AGF71814.1 hypothetical protein A605_04015 [Corynebacterium halotolerans YIM 70093 = DSM 44683]
MKVFKFEVDEKFAQKNNEMLRDTRRLQLSAVILGVLFLVAAAVLAFWVDAAWGPLVGVVAAVLGVISFVLAFVVPRKVGTAQDLYDRYPLAPAVIAEVNPRDFVLLALVNTNVDPDRPPRWGVAVRTVTRVNGVTPKLGTKIPVAAVQGRRSMRDQEHWDEITPMPIAWGTPDQDVVTTARRAIPQDQWDRLEKARKRLNDAKATQHNLLVL